MQDGGMNIWESVVATFMFGLWTPREAQLETELHY